VITFSAVLVFMAIVFYLVRLRRHPEEDTHET
jgi:hypothetical protein